MTPEQFIEARRIIGWPRTEIARRLACNEKTIRQMETGQRGIPASVAKWLDHVARWCADHPAPEDWRVRF